MNHRFIVLQNYFFTIDCHCQFCEEAKNIEMKRGMIITITPEKKYVDNLGWYFLLDIDKQFQLYINIDDFTEGYFEQKYCSLLDFDLKLNYLEYKVNLALDEKNAEGFIHYSCELKKLTELRERVEEELGVKM